MIAEIQPSFSSHLSMSRKIEYQLSKVKEGNGKVLCTSTGDELAAMPAYMELISQLNDRVKLPYAEFILSLYPGERETCEWPFIWNLHFRIAFLRLVNRHLVK